MFFFLPAFLAASHIASAAAILPQPTSETFGFDQGPPEIFTPIHPRSPSQAFVLQGIGELSAPFGVDDRLTRIFMEGNRQIDTFLFDGTTLLANNHPGVCYINQHMGYLACEKIQGLGFSQVGKEFSLATNGTLLYNGSANWWACSDREPDVYNIYCRRTSPNCKLIQLQSGAVPKTKRSLLKHSVEKIVPDTRISLDTRAEKDCFFYMRIPRPEREYYDLNNQLRKGRIYTLLGKRLGTGPNGFHYCYINAATFQLVCAEKTSQELMDNFHSIDFSINEKGYLTHNGKQDWVFCKTSKGWDGPYSEKKVSDSKCEAVILEIMVTVIAGYDCRPQMTKSPVLARAWGSKSSANDLCSRCTFHTERLVSDGHETVPLYPGTESQNEFSLIGGRLTWLSRDDENLASCFWNITDSRLGCSFAWGNDKIPGPDLFSIDPTTHYLLHENKDTWYQCSAATALYAENPMLGLCSQIHVKAINLSCQGPKNGATSSKLDLRSVEATKNNTESSPVACPTNLSNTLFKSPTLLIPISSETKTQALGLIKNITITPTKSIIFTFTIPTTKPYQNQECSLLLLLPSIDSLTIDYQEGQIPGLQFYEVGGPADEHTTFDTLPISPFWVSKTFPNEIRPGKNNFVTTLACGSGVRSVMVVSRGELGLGVRQEGVPNESGLFLVPCVEENVV